MALKKYNNLLTSGRWTNKGPKDSQILALVGVAQKLADIQINNLINPTHTTRSQLREIHNTPGTSHPGC